MYRLLSLPWLIKQLGAESRLEKANNSVPSEVNITLGMEAEMRRPLPGGIAIIILKITFITLTEITRMRSAETQK